MAVTRSTQDALTSWKCRKRVWDRTRSGNTGGTGVHWRSRLLCRLERHSRDAIPPRSDGGDGAMPAIGVRSLSRLIRDYRSTHAWTSRRDVRSLVQVGIVA